MHFRFDPDKTLQAIGVLLEADDGRMGYLRLLKLLYITDRELLAESGRTLTGDRAVAMKNGPVLSHVYDTIKGQTSCADTWFQFIHKQGYKIVLKQPPGRGKLSKREVAKLVEVSDRFNQLEDFDLAEQTHLLEEWRKNYHEGTSTPIPWQDALLAQNRADLIPIAEADAATRASIDAVFGS